MATQPKLTPKLSIDRLMAELMALAQITEAEPPAVTRVVFGEADLRARAYVKGLCAAAGLTVSEDAIGNTFARWQGSDPELAPIGTGSHIDAIPNAGLYDGCVGVLGGLEAIRVLQQLGFKPRRSIELVIFTAEEPTRFGIGCLGSRMMAGLLTPRRRSLCATRRAADWKNGARRPGLPGRWNPFRFLLDDFINSLSCTSSRDRCSNRKASTRPCHAHRRAGQPAHRDRRRRRPCRRQADAGTQRRAGRRGELILALESAAKSTGVIDTVGTVGICEVFPGAVNSVPSRVLMTTDVRDIDSARRDSVLAALAATVQEVSARRGVKIATELVNADPPTTCDPAILAALEAPRQRPANRTRRWSAAPTTIRRLCPRIAPVAMLFIPCRGGVSHRPDEYASPEWIGSGVHVLARTLALLAE